MKATEKRLAALEEAAMRDSRPAHGVPSPEVLAEAERRLVEFRRRMAAHIKEREAAERAAGREPIEILYRR